MKNFACRIWTPILNAKVAYEVRLDEPQATYEHIWRLIHIHESLVVMLGTVLASRLMHLWKKDTDRSRDLIDLRLSMRGSSRPTSVESAAATKGVGCLGGSIGAWLDFLGSYGRREDICACSYCKSLKDYLVTTSESDLAFLPAWKQIAPVTETFEQRQTRLGVMQAINSLRNKLAHVPIPEKILARLHCGLRYEVYRLLTDDLGDCDKDVAIPLRTTKWLPPLKGLILSERWYVTGTDSHPHGKDLSSLLPKSGYGFEVLSEKEPGTGEIWPAGPFVRLDGEKKPSLLFRLVGLEDDLYDDLTGEYYRFAAEMEPVTEVVLPGEIIADWVGPDRGCTGATDALGASTHGIVGGASPSVTSDPADLTSYQLRKEGDMAFADRDFAFAVRCYDELGRRNDSDKYNEVAKSLHGAALWRTAVAEHDSQGTNTSAQLQRAVDLLLEAANHKDVRYAATALYQRSKALFHLWRLEHKAEHLRDAIEDARKAASLTYNPAHISWMERLKGMHESSGGGDEDASQPANAN